MAQAGPQRRPLLDLESRALVPAVGTKAFFEQGWVPKGSGSSKSCLSGQRGNEQVAKIPQYPLSSTPGVCHEAPDLALVWLGLWLMKELTCKSSGCLNGCPELGS